MAMIFVSFQLMSHASHVHHQLQTDLRSMFATFLLAFDVCHLASYLHLLFAIYLYALAIWCFSMMLLL